MSRLNLNRSLIFAAVAGALCIANPAAGQDAYDYGLIELPGSATSQVFDINMRGVAVGNANLVDDDGTFLGTVPFSYDVRKDTFDLLPEAPGFDRTAILGNNDRGILVGSVDDDANLQTSGVIIDKKGRSTVFDHPDAPSFTQARAINSRGTISGFRDTNDPEALTVGFLYDSRTGAFTDIVPSGFTIAQGINSRGESVGSAIFFPGQDDPCNPGVPATDLLRYAWLRSADGEVSYFTVNAGRSSARGISDSGTITGFSSSLVTGTTEGFVTSAGITNCADIAVGPDGIVAVPGALATFPQAITNWGAVTGSYIGADGLTRSFFATPN